MKAFSWHYLCMCLYINFTFSLSIRCRWEQKQISIQYGRDHKTDEVSRCGADVCREDSCRFALRWEFTWGFCGSLIAFCPVFFLYIKKECWYLSCCVTENMLCELHIYFLFFPIISPLHNMDNQQSMLLFIKAWCAWWPPIFLDWRHVFTAQLII